MRELVAIFAPIEMATRAMSAEKCVSTILCYYNEKLLSRRLFEPPKTKLLRNFTADDRTNSKWVEHPLKEFRI